jgi:hypothetical protein
MKAVNRVQEITNGVLFAILTVFQLRGLILGSPRIEPTTRKNPGEGRIYQSVEICQETIPNGSGSNMKVSALSRA